VSKPVYFGSEENKRCRMAIPLTKEQQQAIDSTEVTPPEVVDPRMGEAYVLTRAEEYETVREVLVEEQRQKAIRAVALRNAAGRMQKAPKSSPARST
jgi:hypothetical protein